MLPAPEVKSLGVPYHKNETPAEAGVRVSRAF